MKPVTVHERMVDGELLRAIEKIDANLQSLELSHAAALRRIEELQAEVLSFAAARPLARVAQATVHRNGRS